MNKTFEVKRPVQVFVGSFNSATGKHKTFIPVPLKLTRNDDGTRALEEAAIDAAGDYHGAGIILSEDGHGNSRHAVLVEVCANEYSRHGLPFGNWIIQYDYNNDEGTHSHKLFLAAEIV